MMSGTGHNQWEEEENSGALGNLLERINQDFRPTQQFQPGFVPAASPLWTSVTTPQSNLCSVDPQSNVSSHLHGHIQGGQNRSYSANQELYADVNNVRSPLMRSSSDLGMRLGPFQGQASHNFAERSLDGILDSSLDSLDSGMGVVRDGNSVFFPEPHHCPPGTTNSNTPPPLQPQATQTLGNMRGTSPQQFSFYSESENILEGMSVNNITAKLSNFTASLGSWFNPLDQFRSDISTTTSVDTMLSSPTISSTSVPAATVRVDSRHQNQINNANLQSRVTTPSPSNVQINKPRYSDVLSMNTSTSDKMSGASNIRANNTSQYPSQSPSPNLQGNRNNHNSGFGKSKNRTIGSSSNNNSGNNYNSSYNPTYNQSRYSSNKNDVGGSRVGLDAFDTPLQISQCNGLGVSNHNNRNFTHGSGDYLSEKIQNGNNVSNNSNGDSPSHCGRRSSIRVEKKTDRFDGINKPTNISDSNERIPSDQLNNRFSTSHPKTQPKKPAYINNNLATSSSENLSCNPPPTYSNNINQKNEVNKSKTMQWSKEDCKSSINDEDSIPTPSPTTSTNNNQHESTGPSHSSSSSSFSGRSRGQAKNSGRNNNREFQQKKSYGKRRKDDRLFYSELLMTIWAIIVKWTGQAGLWLVTLTLEVAELSGRLGFDLLVKTWTTSGQYLHLLKVFLWAQLSRLGGVFSQNKGDGKKSAQGRGDRRQGEGLESNLSLPTTGEEAMKRLLACRGKDPYSILGVTRGCTDDDIKRYYKRQAFLVHPDKNKQPGAEEAFKILAHAFEIIGEPDRRNEYDTRVAEEAQLEGHWGELASLLVRLQEKLEEAANTIRCTNCNRRHKRLKLDRPTYAARHCAECRIRHAAREGDIWAESKLLGLRWRYYACMEGAVYDISEWAACQYDNLKHLQANTHSVQYRIVSGKRSPANKPSAADIFSSEEEFFNNLCRDRFGQDYMPGNGQSSAGNQPQSDSKRRKGRKKK